MARTTVVQLFAAAAMVFAALPAGAQEQDNDIASTLSEVSIMGRSLEASLKLSLAPDYRGSDEYKFGPSGSISLSSPDTHHTFSAPDDGFGIGLVGDDSVSAGLSGRLLGKRKPKRDLQGFDKVDRAVEAGAFVNWWPSDELRIRGELRRGFGGHKGWVADFGADAVRERGVWLMSVGPRLHWADSAFTQTYFGVDALAASRSPFGIAPYRADGAFWSAGALASVEYRWKRHWSLIADADYRRLLGEAARSPIVDRLGSADQFSASLGVRYSFGR